MNGVINLDLLSVGVIIAAAGILGFIIYSNNPRSITNKAFLFFSLVTILYSIVNYLQYHIEIPERAILVLRLTLFVAVWHAYAIFQLFYVFPKEKIIFPKYYKFILFPVVVFTAFLTMTPFVLLRVTELSETGSIANVENGPGIALFGILVSALIIAGIILFIIKAKKVGSLERIPFKFILTGTFITFALILVFNFIFPALFGNARFINLAPIFFLPFIFLTSYAIFKHHFLNIKIISTEILTFFLSIVVLYEVIFSENSTIRILRLGVFLLVLALSILLIRTVRREVEQRERLEILSKELESANEKLKALDQLRAEFLSFAAHQVKSPMATVKGWATLIYDGTYGQVSNEVKEAAKKIKTKADQLIALVNNLLNMRQIEEGRMEFNFQEGDLVKFIAEIADDYRLLAHEKKLDFRFESTLFEMKMQFDEQKLRQVIQNLLDNSVKYTDKGFVSLRIDGEGEYVFVSISDSGRGMSKDLQKKLFQQFVRDEKTKLEIQGTGLGLFIAKQIVEAHHGTIKAESQGEGKGSTFTVSLRKKA